MASHQQALLMISPGLPFSDIITGLGPRNYWRVAEASGTTAVDAQGHDDGVYSGTITFSQTSLVSGDSNTSIAVANSGSMRAVGTAPTSWQASGQTFGGIFKPTGTITTTQVLMHVGDASVSNRQGFDFYLDSNYALHLQWFNGSFKQVASANNVITPDVSNLLIFRMVSTTDVNVMVNNTRIDIDPTDAIGLPQNAITWAAFNSGGSFSNKYTGGLDELFNVTRVLTDAECTDLYNAML